MNHPLFNESVNDLPEYDQLSSLQRGNQFNDNNKSTNINPIKILNKENKEDFNEDNFYSNTNPNQINSNFLNTTENVNSVILSKNQSFRSFLNKEKNEKKKEEYQPKIKKNLQSANPSTKCSYSLLKEKFEDVYSYLNLDSNDNSSNKTNYELIAENEARKKKLEEDPNLLDEVLIEYQKVKKNQEVKRLNKKQKRANSLNNFTVESSHLRGDTDLVKNTFITTNSNEENENKFLPRRSLFDGINCFEKYEKKLKAENKKSNTVMSKNSLLTINKPYYGSNFERTESYSSLHSNYDTEFTNTLNLVKNKLTERHRPKIFKTSRITGNIQTKIESNNGLLKSLFK